jgi:hypothetical protein
VAGCLAFSRESCKELTLYIEGDASVAKKAKKSTKKPAAKMGAKRRKKSQGMLASAVSSVRKGARKLGL